MRSLYGDAFVVALIEDGHDLRRLVHLGRQVTAHQRSAMEARGQLCEVPGCDIDFGLEIDHTTPWALTRTTTLDHLAWLCSHHHRQKTHAGYRITGPPGHRTWTAPHGTTTRDHPPPRSEPEPDLFTAGAVSS